MCLLCRLSRRRLGAQETLVKRRKSVAHTPLPPASPTAPLPTPRTAAFPTTCIWHIFPQSVGRTQRFCSKDQQPGSVSTPSLTAHVVLGGSLPCSGPPLHKDGVASGQWLLVWLHKHLRWFSHQDLWRPHPWALTRTSPESFYLCISVCVASEKDVAGTKQSSIPSPFSVLTTMHGHDTDTAGRET